MDKEINGLIYEVSDNEVIITDATDDREEYDTPSIIEGLPVAKIHYQGTLEEWNKLILGKEWYRAINKITIIY